MESCPALKKSCSIKAFMKSLLYLLVLVIAIVSCQKEDVAPVVVYPGLMEIPQGFPEMVQPQDNEYNQDRWLLGKRLFYDKVMSKDSSLSCASCHNSAMAFSDDLNFSAGTSGNFTTMNAPTLTNVAYQPYYTSAGGVATLEMHVLVPIQEHVEFDFNILLIADRMRSDATYVSMAQKAYGRIPDPFVITRALACFERSLISGNSDYDKYYFQSDPNALSKEAKKGMDLFFSNRTNCSDCHGGFNFTNYTFENNGLYQEYENVGRYKLTGNDDDIALFKVPTLRNIAYTGPYMHDGSLNTLEDVLNHYNSGGKDHLHKSELIRPLGLSTQEKNELKAFLVSLSDHTFITNPIFKSL